MSLPGGSSVRATRSAQTPLRGAAAALPRDPAPRETSAVSPDVRSTPAEKERVFCADDDESLSAAQHMAAGAAAGMTEHMVMFPVDTVKTRMQSYTGVRDFAARGVVSAARRIAASEGHGALWRGAGAVAISAGPAHALYFAAYEAARARIEATAGADSRMGFLGPLAPAIAGTSATVVLDGVMTPLDVVKQRMQLAARYTSVWACLRCVYATHGMGAFFAGYKATLLMNVPYMAVYFSAYESAKSALRRRRTAGDERSFSAGAHCLAGGVAGGAAAAATNPLDVVKTRLQTQGEVGARRYRGLWDALNSIRVEEGAAGLLRGIRARVAFHVPAAAVCWTTYEFCKHLMGREDEQGVQRP